MAKIESFRGIYYNPAIVADISKVVCPPYDVIDTRGQEDCYQRHPYNIIRLILGKEFSADAPQENKYSRAAVYIEDWLRRNILIRDTENSVYFYEQNFEVAGRKKTRLGFIALLKLGEPGEAASVYPHERTHTAPKEDRLRLIKSVEANLSPIFTIFSDQERQIKNIFTGEVRGTVPFFEAADEAGVRHCLWRVCRRPAVEKIKSILSAKQIFIADGHHRYEVAKTFRDFKRQEGPAGFKDSYNYIMTYFTALEDEGLAILPTHRLVKNVRFSPDDLGGCFTVKQARSREDLLAEMQDLSRRAGVFGLYQAAKFYLLRLKDKRASNRQIKEGPREYKNLDVVILHRLIFDSFLKIGLADLGYEANLGEGLKAVDRGDYQALFILNPTKIEQIRCIALSGEVMPQKSTYFYPKLLSGFLIHQF